LRICSNQTQRNTASRSAPPLQSVTASPGNECWPTSVTAASMTCFNASFGGCQQRSANYKHLGWYAARPQLVERVWRGSLACEGGGRGHVAGARHVTAEGSMLRLHVRVPRQEVDGLASACADMPFQCMVGWPSSMRIQMCSIAQACDSSER